MGEAAFGAAWAASQALSLDEAIAEAETIAAVPTGQAEPLPPSAPAPFGLTTREREVLHLLARRYTDREIGQVLFLSPRTVARHVGGILAKLGVHSRREAAAFAAEHGLI